MLPSQDVHLSQQTATADNLWRNMGPNMLGLSPLSTSTPIFVRGFVYDQCWFAETPLCRLHSIQKTKDCSVTLPYTHKPLLSLNHSGIIVAYLLILVWGHKAFQNLRGLLLAFVTPLPTSPIILRDLVGYSFIKHSSVWMLNASTVKLNLRLLSPYWWNTTQMQTVPPAS